MYIVTHMAVPTGATRSIASCQWTRWLSISVEASRTRKCLGFLLLLLFRNCDFSGRRTLLTLLLLHSLLAVLLFIPRFLDLGAQWSARAGGGRCTSAPAAIQRPIPSNPSRRPILYHSPPHGRWETCSTPWRRSEFAADAVRTEAQQVQRVGFLPRCPVSCHWPDQLLPSPLSG